MSEVDIKDQPPSWLELEKVLPLSPDVEAYTSLSTDTLKRRFPEYIIQLSPRRLGMKLRNVLKITEGTESA